MKTTLLLDDKIRPTKLMLQNIAPTQVIPREIGPVAGCTCDRWGHPCLRCADREVQLPILTPAEQTR
jgi:hypothetical protein